MNQMLAVSLLFSLCAVHVSATAPFAARSASKSAPGTIVNQAGPDKTRTPAAGSPERKMILDAVRRKLKVKSQFKVDHLKVNGAWAYLRGGEVVNIEGELQETDLGVDVLLKRRGVKANSPWTVVEIWTLPTDTTQPLASFDAKVRRRQKAENIPQSIFPSEL